MSNVLLLAMSTLPPNLKDNYYICEEDIYGEKLAEPIRYTGRSQLEPITHMLYDQLKERDEELNHVIILETESTQKSITIQTMNNEDSDNGREISAVDYYIDRVNKLCGKDIGFQHVKIDENIPDEGIELAINKIMEFANESEDTEQTETAAPAPETEKFHLWIDTQGGFRDIVLVCNAIISLLKEQGIEPEGIFSIQFDPKKNNIESGCPIINQTKKYNVFKFVSAMQEFIDYGKATGLKKYYEDNPDQSSEQTKELVKVIRNIADAIQMCQPGDFEAGIAELKSFLEKLDKDKLNTYLRIFVDFIKKDYGKLMENPDDTIKQIDWCLKKEFYQQALTIYIENLPKYYIENKRVPEITRENAKVQPGHDIYGTMFYEYMYDSFIQNDENEESSDDNELKELRKILKNISTDISGMNESKEKSNKIKSELGNRANDNNIKSPIKEALGGIKNCLKDIEKGKNVSGTDSVILNKLTAKYTAGRLNQITNSNDILNYFLTGTTDIKKNDTETKTYRKKVKAIDNAKKYEATCSLYKDLPAIMEYYLAAKMYRNRMNHASETGISDDEKEAIEYLKNDGIIITIKDEDNNLKFDFSKLKDVLSNGISIEKNK